MSIEFDAESIIEAEKKAKEEKEIELAKQEAEAKLKIQQAHNNTTADETKILD
jgi:hypothetical protein